tara:strand:- start:1445 stop:2233 length:789 start_codon:yes stop_codon:yes gene_type:complete
MSTDAEKEHITLQFIASKNQLKLNELHKRFSPIVLTESLLEMFTQHIESTMPSTRPLTFTDAFYACDENGVLSSMDDKQHIEFMVESLWWGSDDIFYTTHRGLPATLRLDPVRLKNGKPVPILSVSDGKRFAVVQRAIHRMHSLICKHHPSIPGIVVDRKHVEEWAKDALLQQSAEVYYVANHSALKKLMTLWLGETKKEQRATLFVDSSMLQSFVKQMTEHRESRCHFTCNGQDVMNAYILLTAKDDIQSELFLLPIGSLN